MLLNTKSMQVTACLWFDWRFLGPNNKRQARRYQSIMSVVFKRRWRGFHWPVLWWFTQECSLICHESARAGLSRILTAWQGVIHEKSQRNSRTTQRTGNAAVTVSSWVMLLACLTHHFPAKALQRSPIVLIIANNTRQCLWLGSERVCIDLNTQTASKQLPVH